MEAKFYSARPEVTKDFETNISGSDAGGDGAGMTRRLAQAGANGAHVARAIVKKSV